MQRCYCYCTLAVDVVYNFLKLACQKSYCILLPSINCSTMNRKTCISVRWMTWSINTNDNLISLDQSHWSIRPSINGFSNRCAFSIICWANTFLFSPISLASKILMMNVLATNNFGHQLPFRFLLSLAMMQLSFSPPENKTNSFS